MLKPTDIERALRGVDDQPSFLTFLADTLGWPIDPAVKEVRDITYGWSAADLRSADLDETLKARQIASLDPDQPWGIFLLEFKKPDAFLNDRGITGTLRKVLRGLVESRAKDASTPSWKREHLLFVCTHDYKHFRIAYFKKPPGDLVPGASKTPPLAAFGWGSEKSSQTAFRYNLPHLEWPEDPSDALGWVEAWTKAFDVERVTTKFYTEYKALHDLFVETARNVEGGPDKRSWIAGVVLNRLMFVYFLQRRGFLDGGDAQYLEGRFATAQKKHPGQFYRCFLTTLFFDGFATQERSDATKALIGDIKYLNGGLFVRNGVELAADAARKPIDWPDESFDVALKLFQKYSWNLDDAASGDDNEINPDVLGYIFERYINDRADMGAYYTKEDITDYIGKNTILPFLLDRVAAACPEAFKPGGVAWRKLAASPSKYLYPSVRRGVLDANDRPIPLPDDIAAGEHDVSKRAGWNRTAPAPFGLPTETWREHVARRQRCLALHAKLAAGEVSSVNDLITLNLDVTRFTLDLIADGDAAVVDVFATAIERLSVLDPTCGSGAFLFAALNLLADVYDACLTRMDASVSAFRNTPDAKLPKALVGPLGRFRATVARVADHANRGYFVAKTIIVNNLYGVDLMPEAVEICKLRLFLRLVGQVDRVDQVEPLPDIDFNVQAGNTLVGFASEAEAYKAMDFGTMDFGVRARIDVRMAEVDALARRFREGQLVGRGMIAHDAGELKVKLLAALGSLRDDLDGYLANGSGIGADKLAEFRESHQPFHWHVEFHAIMQSGGFDIVIGNPPYVEYRNVRSQYTLHTATYATIGAENLYAFCMERSYHLLAQSGRFGMIVPSSAAGLDETATLRRVTLNRFSDLHVSTYSIRPARLFEGVDQRLCIAVGGSGRESSHSLHTSQYRHWNVEERPSLFATLGYTPSLNHARLDRIAQLGDETSRDILAKIEGHSSVEIRDLYATPTGKSFLAHYHRSPRYWIRAMDFEQYFKSATRSRSVHHFRDINFRDEVSGKCACAAINSSLFFFWFLTVCNGRNLTSTDVERFPIGTIAPASAKRLVTLFDRLMEDYKSNSVVRVRRDCEYQEFRPSLSKPILDQIDQVLAEHYGFTQDEADVIVNFHAKYRMGSDDEAD